MGVMSNDDRSPGPQPVPGPPRRRPEEHGDDDAYQVTIFSAVGGQPFFDRLVDRFYDAVAHDDVLLRLYPDQVDLAPARRRLALFLGQYWGGPTTYSDERGHPRLRMRHAPFVIGDAEREHWVLAMRDALALTLPEAPLDPELRDAVGERMRDYFDMAAESMVNAPG
jgi:hemoglobin